ncbi:MAG TPA: FHA domain-containing protein [Candidatus Nanopelagicales bacterium]
MGHRNKMEWVVIRTCARCGQEASDLARFCSNCGAPLVDLSAEHPAAATGNLDVPISSTGPLGPIDGATVGGVAPGTAMLIVRRGPSEGTTFQLSGERTTIGRGDDADVLLDDVTVSRRHAELLRTAEGWQLRDVGSLNGTYVNRHRIEETILAGGDEVQIGKYRFVFLVGGQG